MEKLSKINQSVLIANERGYRVSDSGSVFNQSRRKIKLYMDKNGYNSFSIRVDAVNVWRVYVHKLQAFQKYGYNLFKNGIVVRHLNAVRDDNSKDNIAIGTQSDNMLDVPKERRILEASNPIHDHVNILKDRELGFSYQQLMQKYNISSKGTLSYIINNSLKAKTKPKRERK